MNPYVEMTKLVVQVLFTLIAQGKMTMEELDKTYNDEVTKFKANPPSTLPDV